MATHKQAKPDVPADEALDKLLNDAPPDPRGETKNDSPARTRDTGEDKAVGEIEAEDKSDALDELYEQESEPEAPMLVTGDEKHPRLAKLKKPKFWIILFAVCLVIALFAWLITPSRIWLLNTFGLRSSMDIATLVSTAEGTPPILKNATVTINDKTYQTDDSGRLRVTLPYGPVHIVVAKQGYESVTKDHTLDFDPFFYKLGGQAADTALRNVSFALKNVGVLATFTAKDWLTGNPLATGTFSVGDVAAMPDTNGVVTLALPATDAATIKVAATFGADYANTTVEVPVGSTKPDLLFVPAGKDYFLSKRTGQYGVYASNIDGSGVTEIITPAANETGDIAFSVSPSQKFAALASTREVTRDTFGSVQQKLYLVDLATNKLTPLDTALRFRIADWAGDTVVYVAESQSGSGMQARLGSINALTAKQTTLATAASIGVVRVRLASAVYLLGNGELHTVPVAGGTEKTLGTIVGGLTQTDANHIAFQTADHTWHQYDINADQLSNAPTPTSSGRAYLAAPSANGQTNIVLDTLDGKPSLIAKDVGSGKETTLYAGADLTGPVRWVGNIVVYRAGATDYVVSPAGGAPKKITEVSPAISVKNDYFTFN